MLVLSVRNPSSLVVGIGAAVAFVMFAVVLAMPASADVFDNQRFTFTVTNMNPCAPEDGLVTLTFEEHDVWQQLADGTILVHSNFHGTGASANGTEYIINRHQVTTVVGGVATAFFELVRISKGAGDNAQIEGMFTFDPSREPPRIQVTTFRCVG